ncbi:hypothetical protein LTR66_009246 [Elasticomyces elasticus]|nr:hypothetical protein LTR66_009246 [Elasticomyces elasticus]
MHPKFIVVDRRRVFLPSCNVSWEEWFEGCVELSGAIVDQFVHFWEDFWKSSHDATIELPNPLDLSGASEEPLLEVTPIFLPSSHHRNPRFRPFPWQPVSAPPRTPLNVFILKAIAAAEQSVYIQTPNLTAIPVLSSVLNALRCGIDVSILTSERLMILEQLVTAGTTTSRCVRKLIKRYKKIQRQYSLTAAEDPESGIPPALGALKVSYFQPRIDSKDVHEPVQSHLKLTLIDDEIVVLGSGNMDRASWYTSQELGVAFFSRSFAARVRCTVDEALRGRVRVVFDSSAG